MHADASDRPGSDSPPETAEWSWMYRSEAFFEDLDGLLAATLPAKAATAAAPGRRRSLGDALRGWSGRWAPGAAA